MKRYIFFLLFVSLFSLSSSAQNDDFGMYYTIGATKKIDKKWSIGAEAELRSRNNARTVDRYSFAVDGQYKVQKWLKFSAAYKFISDSREEKLNSLRNYRPSYFTPKHRIMLSATGSVSWNRFQFSLRERWQYTYRPEKTTDRYDFSAAEWEDDIVRSKAENVLRSRFQIEYDIPKCKFEPYANVELFNNMALERIRLTAGTDYKLSKKHVFSVYYRYQHTKADADKSSNCLHYVGLGYHYKF